jgi:metal-responsive CopG/Arc/MetJ family transcriptional regulator
MSEQIEIYVVSPKKIKIYVPRQLFEEFEQVVEKEDLSAAITEALREELKKIKFRKDMVRISNKVS